MKKILPIIFLCYVFNGFSNFSISKSIKSDSSIVKNRLSHSIGGEIGGTFMYYNFYYDLSLNLKNDNFIGLGYTTALFIPANLGTLGNGIKFFYGFGTRKTSRLIISYGNTINMPIKKEVNDDKPLGDQFPNFYHIIFMSINNSLPIKNSNFHFTYGMGGHYIFYKVSNSTQTIKPKFFVPNISLGLKFTL